MLAQHPETPKYVIVNSMGKRDTIKILYMQANQSSHTKEEQVVPKGFDHDGRFDVCAEQRVL